MKFEDMKFFTTINHVIIIILFHLLTLSSSLNAQPTEPKRTLIAGPGISLNYLTPFAPYNPGYRLGFNYQRNEKWSAGMDFGYG
ncbi:hypothetical protein ACFLRI_03665 [Bacteroidota bacterium]